MLTMICSFQTGLQAARREDLGKCSANRQKLRGLSRHSPDDNDDNYDDTDDDYNDNDDDYNYYDDDNEFFSRS